MVLKHKSLAQQRLTGVAVDYLNCLFWQGFDVRTHRKNWPQYFQIVSVDGWLEEELWAEVNYVARAMGIPCPPNL